MRKEKHIKLSRLISYVLRHNPQVLEKGLDSKAYAYTEDLYKFINENNKFILNEEVLDEIVYSDNKGRYSYNHDKSKIRANQGHSVNVDLGLEELVPPEKLYHGTSENKVESIKFSGLSKMTRNHVHLSESYETSIEVGARHGDPIVIEVDSKKMHEDGYKFYKSENGVWLTNNVPNEYLNI